jgi:transcriptional regulator CtsR
MHALNTMGDRLSQHQAEILIRNFVDYEIIREREARLLLAATSDHSLAAAEVSEKDPLRMNILKNMLTSLIVR